MSDLRRSRPARARFPKWHAAPGRVIAVALALGLCSQAGAATTAMTEQRGFVTEGVAGRLLFQPCEAGGKPGTTLPLRDGTADAALSAGIDQVRQVMHVAQRALYVEIRADQAQGLVTARQFRRAIGHVESCAAAPAALPNDVRLMAEGALPTWRLLAGARQTRIEEPGGTPQQFAALAAAPREGDARSRVFTAKAGPNAAALRVELSEQPCNDERAETAYGARVVVLIGDRRLEGCAARY